MVSQQLYHQTENQLQSEEVIIAQAKKDPACFAPIYKKYYSQIFYFVLRRVESKEQAIEITSCVFVKALNSIHKFEFRGIPFSAWLFRITRNELFDRNKKKNLQLTLSFQDVQIADIIEDTSGEINTGEQIDRMISALQDLNDDEIELIEMRYFEKRPFKEIADILEITENNAKVRTYRILEKLKKKITQNK